MCIRGLSPGGLLGSIFAGYVPLASQSPYPIIVYSVAIIDPILVTFGQICHFRDPNLVTLYEHVCMYLLFFFQAVTVTNSAI